MIASRSSACPCVMHGSMRRFEHAEAARDADLFVCQVPTWTGACTGQQAQCLIAITGELETAVIFELEGVNPTTKPTAPSSKAPATARPPATATVPGSTSPPATSSGPPTDAPPTSAPTAAALPTPEPTLDPGPSTAEGGSGPVIILLALLLTLLLGGLGVVVVRERRKGAGST